jgi:hypothetical protein
MMPGKDSPERTARTGQREQDSQKSTARKGQSGKDSKYWTARLIQDCHSFLTAYTVSLQPVKRAQVFLLSPPSLMKYNILIRQT